jgi:hypothetical protein
MGGETPLLSASGLAVAHSSCFRVQPIALSLSRPSSGRELPVLVIHREQAFFDKLSLVGVRREGKGAELVGHEIVAGRGFTFLRVKEQQLLEIRMPHRLADCVQQGQQQPLAFK